MGVLDDDIQAVRENPADPERRERLARHAIELAERTIARNEEALRRYDEAIARFMLVLRRAGLLREHRGRFL